MKDYMENKNRNAMAAVHCLQIGKGSGVKGVLRVSTLPSSLAVQSRFGMGPALCV